MRKLTSTLIALSGITALLLTGCQPPPVEKPLPFEDVAAADVVLITRVPQDNPTSLEALIFGRLWITDGCVTIGDSAADSRTTIWRAGYRVGKDSEGMFVYHPKAHRRHRIGEEVRFGGGYIETLTPDWIAEWIAGGDLRGCPGPFIFVDTTGDE